MHKMASRPITLDCFEIDDCLYVDTQENSLLGFEKAQVEGIIGFCEMLRKKYLETQDKRYWKELIRWLPESWLQTRTVTMSYENLYAMCGKGQRRFHKLNEWSGKDNPELNNFIKWARTLPYAQEFIFIDEVVADKELEKNEKEKCFDKLINELRKLNINVDTLSCDELLNYFKNIIDKI